MKRLAIAAAGLAVVVGVVACGGIACSADSAEESYREAGREWLARWGGLGFAGVVMVYDDGEWDEMMKQLVALDMSGPLSGEGAELALLAGWVPLSPPKLEHLTVALQIYHDARDLADPMEEEMMQREAERPQHRWDCNFYGSYKYERICNLLLNAERNLIGALTEWKSSIEGALPVWDRR